MLISFPMMRPPQVWRNLKGHSRISSTVSRSFTDQCICCFTRISAPCDQKLHSLLHLQHLKQCLARSRHSINICWMNGFKNQLFVVSHLKSPRSAFSTHSTKTFKSLKPHLIPFINELKKIFFSAWAKFLSQTADGGDGKDSGTDMQVWRTRDGWPRWLMGTRQAILPKD